MKKNLLIAVSSVIGMITTAKVEASELNVKMFDRSLISVSIDKGPFTIPAPKADIRYIPEGYRHVTIYRYSHTGYELVFNETVFIPAKVEMKAVINHAGSLNVTSILYHQIFPSDPYNYNCYNNYSYNNVQPCNNNVFGANDFDALKNTIQQQSFDDTRMTIAKQAAQRKMLSAQQVAELMRLFSFESTRLDFAKYAYQHTYDKDRYYIVNNAFSFSSSIDELVSYISHG